jgi:hypothetical protein
MAGPIKVYVELGTKRAFAGAIDWPGWCRSGKDEASALQDLFEYGSRYADVLQGSGVPFAPPKSLAELKVVERLKGGSTTDFGAPGAYPSADQREMDPAELKRSEALLRACWARLDAAARRAQGRTLRTGPRGGGRSLPKMLDHVREAEEAYLGALGWWSLAGKLGPKAAVAAHVRGAALKGIKAAAAGEIPATGPRGGRRWSARYFVRRAAWHVLDHAWEIEDRLA